MGSCFRIQRVFVVIINIIKAYFSLLVCKTPYRHPVCQYPVSSLNSICLDELFRGIHGLIIICWFTEFYLQGQGKGVLIGGTDNSRGCAGLS